MRKLVLVSAVLVMLMGTTALSVAADDDIPPHGHMLILGIEFGDDGSITYRKCVDLANNQALKLNAHHDHVHVGTAGDALRNAGHYPVPTSPLSPIDNCAHLAEIFGPPTK
jgi:hypothetical protein